jgi:tripartite-type tricarboxylate transporter receptor subunit TctC
MNLFRTLIAAGLVALLGVATATAQPFPSRPVRIVVPFSTGSVTDLLARTVGEKLTEGWGHQVVVENRPGAASVVGTGIAAKAAPDGYTLLMVSNGHSVIGSLYSKLPFDPITDFSGVTRIASVTLVLIVPPTLPVTTLKEFIALAKGKPGTLNYASAGLGSTAYMSAELFKHVAKVDIVHVPYKGLPEALTDTMTGRVQMYFLGLIGGLSHIQTGRVRALSVNTARRSPALPDVPTMEEAGLPGYAYDAWFGLLAPGKTPRAMVARLNRDVVHVLKMPEVVTRLSGAGAEPNVNTPEQFDALIKADATRFGRVLKDAGIQPQ